MGLFSSAKQRTDGTFQNSEAPSSREREREYEEETITSPTELKLRERHRQLDSLKSKASELSEAFDKIGMLVTESDKTANAFYSFVDQAKLDAENEKRLQAENMRLSTDSLEKSHIIKRQTAQLEKRDAEIQVLKQRAVENRGAIEKARTSISEIRDRQADLTEQLEVKNVELLNVNAKNSEVTEQYDQLATRYHGLDDQYSELKLEYETQSKRENELQQSLAENISLLEEEVRKNKTLASELESNKRGLSEASVSLIELKSEKDALMEELEFGRNAREDDQRKYDNRMFSLKTEIENLTSERRVTSQTLKEMQNESQRIKKDNREYENTVRKLEQQLKSMQKVQDNERKQISDGNSKLSDLNLRFNTALTDLNHEQRQREKLQQAVEELTEQNGKMKEYRSKYEAILDQVADLKGLVADYQELIGKDRLSLMSSGSTDFDPDDDPDPTDDGGNIVKIHR